ncbi:MAG: response regulator [Geobacter sp.]
MGNISILLADDSITIQKVVGIIFAGDGYTLTVVDSGAAAVQKAQEILPDVLLIDVLMPGMNGYEVCEQLRAIPALAAKPILLLTGSFEAFDEAKAKSCGADDHITKPFESQQIIAKVKELHALGQRRASGESVEPIAAVTPAAAEPASFIEPTAFAAPTEAAPAEESFAFEANALETSSVFEPAAPAAEIEQESPTISPDDPWGAFTQPEPQQEEVPTAESESAGMDIELDQPDVMAMMAEEPQTPAVQAADDANIGASWVPVEEQTFEFQEEVAEPPAAVLEQEPPVVVAEEPTMPVVAPAAAPVVAATGAVALSEEQLKEALMSVSKETIERIVWEVVPDLAESLIKETIRRITEGK